MPHFTHFSLSISGTREKIQTIILKQYEQAMAEAEAEEAAAEA